MNTVFYIIIFIIGIMFGSFYATLIKRMSEKKKTFSISSYCTKCGKKLKIWQQIPIISYISLKGKCKYCNKKIDYLYIVLEIITGILFVITSYGLKLKQANSTNIISFIFVVLYYTYIILTIGTDIKIKKMPAPLLAYGIVLSITYMTYLFFTKSVTLYTNTIYLILIIILLLLNILSVKKRAQGNYAIDILTMILIMLIFTEEFTSIITITGTLLSIAIYILIKKIKSLKKKTIYNEKVRIGFILGTINIITLLTLININI